MVLGLQYGSHTEGLEHAVVLVDILAVFLHRFLDTQSSIDDAQVHIDGTIRLEYLTFYAQKKTSYQ